MPDRLWQNFNFGLKRILCNSPPLLFLAASLFTYPYKCEAENEGKKLNISVVFFPILIYYDPL